MGALLAGAGLWLGLCVPATRAGEVAPPASCIDLEVNGERIRDYACISRLLAPGSAPARVPEALGSERLVRQPPSALGLANRAATQQRMGSSFGVSTQPQRPAPPPTPAPLPVPVRP